MTVAGPAELPGPIETAIAELLEAEQPELVPRPEPPRTLDEAAPYWGGRHASTEMAAASGVSAREVQRWRAFETGAAAQRRRPPYDKREAILRTARRRQLAGWRRDNARRRRLFDPTSGPRRHGLRMAIQVPSFTPRGDPNYRRRRTTVMPAAVGGHPRTVRIPPAESGEVMDLWQAGERADAAELLEEHFLTAYGMEATTFDDGFDWVSLEVDR